MAISDTTPHDGDDGPESDNNGFEQDNGFDPETGPGQENGPGPEEVEPFGKREFSPEETEETSEFDLDDDDSRLPWLDGDDEEYEEGGTGQLIAFVLGGLAILGLLVGGIWWFTRGGDDGQMVADGSVIEAPEGPYKERPEDPGGKTFEGTGDSSFAVSEGQTRPAQLGKGDAATGPGFDSVEKPNAPATAGSDSGTARAAPGSGAAGASSATVSTSATAGSAAASGSSSVGVQVGAYSSRAKAEEAWGKMSGSVSALKGMRHRIVEGQADIGKVYRLQAIAGDSATANTLCRKLKAAGQNCYVKD